MSSPPCKKPVTVFVPDNCRVLVIHILRYLTLVELAAKLQHVCKLFYTELVPIAMFRQKLFPTLDVDQLMLSFLANMNKRTYLVFKAEMQKQMQKLDWNFRTLVKWQQERRSNVQATWDRYTSAMDRVLFSTRRGLCDRNCKNIFNLSIFVHRLPRGIILDPAFSPHLVGVHTSTLSSRGSIGLISFTGAHFTIYYDGFFTRGQKDYQWWKKETPEDEDGGVPLVVELEYLVGFNPRFCNDDLPTILKQL